MNILTHTLAPVIAASAVNIISSTGKKKQIFELKHLLFIGLAGALPDLLGIHFSLSGRYTSWTHTIWFLLGLYPVLIFISCRFFRKQWILISHTAWLAAVFHLYIDSLSGGIAPLYPLSETIWGSSLIIWEYWSTADFFLFCFTAILILAVSKNEIKERMLAAADSMHLKSAAGGQKLIFRSGLVTGLILNIIDFYLNGAVLHNDWTMLLNKLHIDPIGPAGFLYFILFNFAAGMLLIWLYTVLLFRYQDSIKAVKITAGFMWFTVWFLHNGANLAAGIYTFKLFFLTIVLGFFEIITVLILGVLYYHKKADV